MSSPTICIACRCGGTWTESPARFQGGPGVAYVVTLALAEVSAMAGKVPLCREHQADFEEAKTTLLAAAHERTPS